MRGQKYGDEDIERGLQALAEAGGNAARASLACGIPERTLRGWKINQFADEFAELRREKRTDLISKVWDAAELALDLLLKKLPRMEGRYLTTAFGVLAEKGLLLGGEIKGISELPQMVFRGVDPSEYEEREQE
jgi:hypothetical protein